MALQLRLIDRSRYETGEGKCRRERWLNYSWTNGYGLRKRKQSIYLASGTTYHDALRPVLEFAQAHRRTPTVAELRELILPALDAFKQKGLKRNIDLGVAEERAHEIINEQITLSAGLTFAWTQRILPWIIQTGRIIEIEKEDVTVHGCTCQLGDLVGTAEQHDARGCMGTGWQSRPDFIHEDLGGSLTYHDFKGTGWLNEGWKNSWPYKIQVMVGAMGSQQRLGRPITQVMIHGLYKGARKGAYNPDTRKYDGDPQQQTPLCYAYHRPGNPPLWQEGWQLDYPSGKGARDWKKKGVWHYPGGAWAWFQQLPPETLDAAIIIVGPFAIKEPRVQQFLRQMVANEGRWADLEVQLYERLMQVGGDWTHPQYRALLDTLVPQSNDCYRFGKPCAFLPICDEQAGWETPLAMGYELRRPHHEPELLQMRERGLEPPEDLDEVDDDE